MRWILELRQALAAKAAHQLHHRQACLLQRQFKAAGEQRRQPFLLSRGAFSLRGLWLSSAPRRRGLLGQVFAAKDVQRFVQRGPGNGRQLRQIL